jgi:hypothetical protein
MPLTRDAVLRLAKSRTAPICPSCISKSLGVTFQQAFDAVLDIELRRDHIVRDGVCGECREEHLHVLWPSRRHSK